MTWPWVSRLAYDTLHDSYERALTDLKNERDRLDDLIDHLKRIDRREHRMSEEPQKPKRKVIQIPPEIEEICTAWENPALQDLTRNRARQLYREHKSWETVKSLLEVEAAQ